MNKTQAEFFAEYPWLDDAEKLMPKDALWMAYNLGRIDGGMQVLERQALARDRAEAGEGWGRA